MEKKTLLITNESGKGIVTIVANNIAIKSDMPSEQVGDITNLPDKVREKIKENPSNFNSKGEKRTKSVQELEAEKPSKRETRQYLTERIVALEKKVQKIEEAQSKVK